jgi:hypothetical protein
MENLMGLGNILREKFLWNLIEKVRKRNLRRSILCITDFLKIQNLRILG